MAISIEIQNSREYEDCRSSKFLSRLCALLIDRDLCSEPRPHLLLPLCERAAWQVLRDLPSFGEQERSKPPLGLLYSRQVSSLLGDLLMEWWKLLSTQHFTLFTKIHSLRSTSFTTEEIYNLFGGFCPISGSPVRPSAWSKWGSIPFKKASNTGQSTTGSNSQNDLPWTSFYFQEAWAYVAGRVCATCKSLSRRTLWRWRPGREGPPLTCL